MVAQHSRLPECLPLPLHQMPLSEAPWKHRELDDVPWEEREIAAMCSAQPQRPEPPVPVLTDVGLCWADNVTALRAVTAGLTGLFPGGSLIA